MHNGYRQQDDQGSYFCPTTHPAKLQQAQNARLGSFHLPNEEYPGNISPY
jgi:hypothetical protein